jgi:hypothetical protein
VDELMMKRHGCTFVGLSLVALASLLAWSRPPAVRADERVDELERKVDALTQEIQDLKLGAVADTTRLVPRYGLGLGASKAYGARGVSVGGYGEMLYSKFDGKVGEADRLDFLRHVLYLGYKFNDELLLNSEVEIEHAGVKDEAEVEVDPGTGEGETELSGEVVLEFAYLDWLLDPEINVRAGMLLVPLGLTNEAHEPIAFLGARRPEVEQAIIPTTWSANGVGIHGTLAKRFSYRAYVVEGLNAAHFGAEGIRGGRQGGSQALLTHPSLAGRVDFDGVEGLMVGGSVFTGNCFQVASEWPGTPGEEVPFPDDLRLTLWDAHARFEHHGFEARALYARGTIDNVRELWPFVGTLMGSSFYGWYVEGGYDLMQSLRLGSNFRLVPYVRVEKYDTQEDLPSGFAADESLEHRIVTVGAALQPHPNVTLKIDRSMRSSPAETESSQWNAALGYVF